MPSADADDRYRSLLTDSFSLVSQQRGTYRTIGHESPSLLEYVAAALDLRLDESVSSAEIPDYTLRALQAYALAPSLEDLQASRRQRIAYWAQRAAALPSPGRGDVRYRVPLEAVEVAPYGADVVGDIRYAQLFDDQPAPAESPVPLADLFPQPEAVPSVILQRALAAAGDNWASLWASLQREVSQGLGVVHPRRPAPADVPDVFYRQFVVLQEKWNASAAEWLQKPCPCDGGTANGVNASLLMRSKVDCNTLDRFPHAASLFMRLLRASGYKGCFSCVIFDYDQAYHRVLRSRQVCCLMPVAAPRGGGQVDTVEGPVWVADREVVYFELFRLLVGEGAAVAGYCCISRIITIIVCCVLLFGTGHYNDDFSSLLWSADSSLPADLWFFITKVLLVALHSDKYAYRGSSLILGMFVSFCYAGLYFSLSP